MKRLKFALKIVVIDHLLQAKLQTYVKPRASRWKIEMKDGFE